jgi:PEGA domain
MKRSVSTLCCVLLLIQTNALCTATSQRSATNQAGQTAAVPTRQPVLEDGTPVRLRIAQTVSSADAHVGDRVEFEVLEEVSVSNIVVIPKGGVAWGTVTEAQHKRRMARGGKLEIVMDSVRLADGEKAALRATKEVKGGGHTGAMTAGIVATGLLVWPAAPFFLFMHGKDITIPKGTEVPTFINGNFPLDLARFQSPITLTAQTRQNSPTRTAAEITIASTPGGADIQLDGNFVGDTPSTISVPAGDHTILVTKDGYKSWERKIKVSGGKVDVTADLQPVTISPAIPEKPH